MYGIENEIYLGGYIPGGDKETYAKEIWDWMIDNGIRSVLDVGCGEGYAVKYFIDNNCYAVGVEGGTNAINNSPVKNHLIQHDYTRGPYISNMNYDAIWCCEFVEHVDKKFEYNFLQTFKMGKTIFLTHAVPGQSGFHHVNCQNAEYWISKMKDINYSFNETLSLYLRKISKASHTKRLLVFNQVL